MTEHNTTTKTSTLAMFDLTAPCDRYSLEEITSWCTTYCKRWCFQRERGVETGYEHFQCRISLISKKRLTTMITWMSNTMPAIHVSPTANATYYSGDEFYVMKEDTRIEGPWSDRTHIDLSSLPIRLRGEPTWRPWQQTVKSSIEQPPDDRTINVAIDTEGNNGKSFLTMWLMSRNIAERIPQQKDGRDIMRMVMNCPIRKCYFIDLPRATPNKDSHALYTAIEEIKNGYCYDDRYRFQRTIFEPPHIWVFTNEIPDSHLVSRDRWRLWTITNGRLIPYASKPIPMIGNGVFLNIIR